MTLIFFAFLSFYNEEEFVGFAFAISNQKAFYISFFAIMPHLRSHGYGKEIIEKLIDFINVPWFLKWKDWMKTVIT